MRIILFLLVSLSFLACKKNNGNPPPPSAIDTLGTGWKKVMVASLPSAIDIFFINNTTGFVVGDNLIYRSTDGGNTWQNVYHAATSFANIAMGSTTNAIIVSYGGNSTKLFVTSNGGNSFDSVTIADGIYDAFFVSPTVAYAIGQKCWKTTNGGLTWTSLFDLGSQGAYRSLYFLNEQMGWCVGAGGVFNTINSGLNWGLQSAPDFSFGGTGSVYFVDANNGYIMDHNSIGKTTNGGATWTKIFTVSSGFHDLHFLTNTLGYITDNQLIYKTTDGGNTWTREVRVTFARRIIELHFTDANHGWATSGDGYILKYEQ